MDIKIYALKKKKCQIDKIPLYSSSLGFYHNFDFFVLAAGFDMVLPSMNCKRTGRQQECLQRGKYKEVDKHLTGL